MRYLAALGLFAGLASPATADVLAATATSFDIQQQVTIDAPPAQTWAMLRMPQKWWSKEHTYSGDSANLYLDSQATGCFCEKLPGKGSVEHARILYVEAPRLLRLRGGLGPLQSEAADGVLTFKLEPEGDNATRLTVTYTVSGYLHAGGEALAPVVDNVLGEQVKSLKAAAEAPAADAADTKGL